MNKSPNGKSKTPLQFKVFHTLLGFSIFFSLITVPAEAQSIQILGVRTTSDFLWWPIVFFTLQLIYGVYGFTYLRQTVYSIIIFRAAYIIFLKFAIWLPASAFWKMQEIYTLVLGRDNFYIIESTFFIWSTILLPTSYLTNLNHKRSTYVFILSLIIFSILNICSLNPEEMKNPNQLIIPIVIYGFLNSFYYKIHNLIKTIEQIIRIESVDNNLFRFHLPDTQITNNNRFKYHHILFSSSILFFIASKTMAAKFISIGFLTINVGGIVFSLAYLTADMMTDVYGIERTKQMIFFIIFCNLLFVFDIWITNFLAIGLNDPFKSILHNQTRMFIASASAFYLGMTLNSTVISIIKSRQRKQGISLKKEFILTVWTRIATSSAFGIIIDVTLFSLVAFYGIVPNEKLGSVIIFEDVYKITYEILLAPITILLIYLLKIKEKVDIYDELSNLNPFRIQTSYKLSANRFDANYVKPKGNNNG